MYLYVKALHIVFVLTWFAGLFYVVRLFVYQTEAQQEANQLVREALTAQLKRMAQRLWYIIAWPSAVLAMACGMAMLYLNTALLHEPWMWMKGGLVVLLFGYHLYCGHLRARLLAEVYRRSSLQLRMINEIPTLLLFPIVFLAVFKRTSGLSAGLLALAGLAVILYVAIRCYKYFREGPPSARP